MTTGGELALATRAVRKSYGSRLALDGLDLSVPTGVVYGFLGPNGAGKTTTMRLLTGLIHADGGSIEMLGRPFARGDRRRLFEVGALVETPSFYPYLSGRENLRALAAAGPKTPKNRVSEVLELVGLTERGGDKVSRYSLGMKQRLGIAGALLSDPKLLLLDEPANGLDPAGIVAMRETLKHFASTGKTVFVSSHLLAEVQQLADVVGIIAKGKLVREGTMRELLAAEGVVRVRVAPDEVPRAAEVLAAMTAPGPGRRLVHGAWLADRPDPAGPLVRDQSGAEPGGDLRIRASRPATTSRSCSWRSRGARPHRSGRDVRWPAVDARRARRTGPAYEALPLHDPQAHPPARDLGHLRPDRRTARADRAGRRDDRRPGRRRERRRERWRRRRPRRCCCVTFPGAYDLILGFILGLGGLFAVIYGAADRRLRVDLGHAQEHGRARRKPRDATR